MHIACAVIKGNVDILHITADGYRVLLSGRILKIIKRVHGKTAFLDTTAAVNTIARNQFPVIPEVTVCDTSVDYRPCLNRLAP